MSVDRLVSYGYPGWWLALEAAIPSLAWFIKSWPGWRVIEMITSNPFADLSGILTPTDHAGLHRTDDPGGCHGTERGERNRTGKVTPLSNPVWSGIPAAGVTPTPEINSNNNKYHPCGGMACRRAEDGILSPRPILIPLIHLVAALSRQIPAVAGPGALTVRILLARAGTGRCA